MTNIEDKLNSLKFKGLDASERSDLWRAVLAKKTARTSLLPFNFALKPMTALLIALAVLISGSGVVAASDAAKPGDPLFGVDLAVERVRMSLASDDHRNELARTFAQERLEEIQALRAKDEIENSDDNSSSSVQISGLTEAEAHVFTNETVVKLELNGHKFGFLTQAKTKAAITDEIVTKYGVAQATVEAKLVLTIEDRTSRPDDKGFLNSEVRASGDISLNEHEKRDIRTSFDQVLAELNDDNATSSAELKAALRTILDASASGKIKFESDGQKTEIKLKDGSLEIKTENKDSQDEDSDKKGDQSGDQNASTSANFKVNLNGLVGLDSDDEKDEDSARNIGEFDDDDSGHGGEKNDD